jgi:hypothetical protein
MNKIIRMWNQNRRAIIIIVLAVAFLIILIQLLNQLAKQAKETKNENTINENVANLPTTSIITGEVVSEKVTKTNVDIIDNFVELCNNGETQKAYELLTDECKEILFATEDEFVNNYYNIIFDQKRTIKIENYKNSTTTNTYLVTFYIDALSTGNANSGDKYQDYITVDVKTSKLNINSLITGKEINAQSEVNGIKINIIRQEIYKDYEIYKINVENNTDKTILLDTRTSSKSMYLVDSSNIKYTAYSNEIASIIYEFTKHVSKTLSLKFNKKYEPDDKTKKVVFSDIVEDYEKYTLEKTEDRLKIEIDI